MGLDPDIEKSKKRNFFEFLFGSKEFNGVCVKKKSFLRNGSVWYKSGVFVSQESIVYKHISLSKGKKLIQNFWKEI